MKILLTGGTGFIGKRLRPELEKLGHWVHAMKRNEDVSRLEVDGVIHLAGETVAQRWTSAARQRIVDSRVEIARAVPAPKSFFVSASAVGIYGDRGDEVLDEASVPGPGFLAEVCRKWESAVLGRADISARRAILRLPPVLGPGGGMLSKLRVPFRLGLGGRLGNGQQWMSWIHLDDAVGMLLRLVSDETLEGVYCGVAPEPVRNADFTRALGESVRRPALLPVPAFALKLALGEMSGALLSSQRVVSTRWPKAGYSYRYPELLAAVKDSL